MAVLNEGMSDLRLVKFLRSFADKGTACVTVGYGVSETETGERSDSGQCCVMIEDGKLSEDDAQRILKCLDTLKIKDALPPFQASEDNWDEAHIFKDGAWKLYDGKMGKGVLYLHCNFYSGIKDCRP